MTQRERYPPEDPREWLNRARSNLARAKIEAPDVYLEDQCFDAQQAAEKAIKAVLLARGIEFPFVHDLSHLSSLLAGSGAALPAAIQGATALTRYATVARYPGGFRPVSEQECASALALAEAVVRWAEEQV